MATSKSKKDSPQDLMYTKSRMWEVNKKRKMARAEAKRLADQSKKMKVRRGHARMMRRHRIALSVSPQ